MRTRYTIINSIAGIIGQVVLAFMNLILRKVFVSTIGLEYLGINGLFSNVLSFLALTESGVGIAMAYSLYVPIANEDKKRICVLMKFYKRIYIYIAIGVSVIGLAIVPVLPYLINDSDFTVGQITLYYLFFLAENVCSYFLAYKSTYLNASQKNYIVTIIRTGVLGIGLVAKIIVLLATYNFILYLLISVLVTIANNIVVSIYVNFNYQYLKKKTDETINQQDKNDLIKNVKGLFLHKIGAFAVFGTDNIIISSFVSLQMVGVYSNYSLILSQLNMVATQIFNALIPSMGNYIAVSTKEEIYDMYKNIQCINFLLYGEFSAILLCVIQPFIKTWIGEQGLLGIGVVYLLIFDFYLKGMRNTIQIVKTAGGVFYQDRFSPLIEATVNLLISILLVQRVGIMGVFIGTIISGLTAPFWITPYFVYKNLLQMPFKEYLKDMLFYLCLLAISGLCSAQIGKIVFVPISYLNILIQGLIVLLVTGLLFIVALHKKKEFLFLVMKVRSIMQAVKSPNS